MKRSTENRAANFFAALLSFRNSKVFKKLNIILVIAWCIVIFCFSAQTGSKSSSLSKKISIAVVNTVNKISNIELEQDGVQRTLKNIEFYVRKTAHFSEYAILAILIFMCLKDVSFFSNRYIAAAFLVALYASTDEIHQLFVPQRAGQFRDVCIDTSGGITALIIIFLIKKIITYRKRKENDRIR
ncbi:VanZ family protein [Lachnobacterium bovis]|uniref:VanZ like family protein n=1 Tax=Lachnobacterium bovis TaxID=140626 RepID=A0A1H9P111_9FIRM|nr:VanZ family protein [Lachnobacterium bovis]SER41870.1 VanZ like family protein [Lachnobacterium bovis]